MTLWLSLISFFCLNTVTFGAVKIFKFRLLTLLYLERSQTHHREHSENHMKVEEKTISFYIDELVNSTLFNAEAHLPYLSPLTSSSLCIFSYLHVHIVCSLTSYQSAL
jgi:hypothetical protein